VTANREDDMKDLLLDRRVQLFLGKFLNGEFDTLSPILERRNGYRYPAVEQFVEAPDESEPFLIKLEERGVLTSEICGAIVCCSKCGSYNVDRVLSNLARGVNEGDVKPAQIRGKIPVKETIWRCEDCDTLIDEGEIAVKPIFCYHFSEKGIEEISSRLVIKPLRDFLHERGYRTESPGTLIGVSNVEHAFDILAFGGGSDEEVLAVDFALSEEPIDEVKVISMFAKVYDANPFKSVLVAFPKLTADARKLAERYKLGVVETNDVKDIWKKMREVVPPVDDFKFEALDVMTLLSLPDHLRKTATVTNNLGRAMADEIAEATTRARAVESGYLNQLVRMGYLKKEREGRKVFFSVVA